MLHPSGKSWHSSSTSQSAKLRLSALRLVRIHATFSRMKKDRRPCSAKYEIHLQMATNTELREPSTDNSLPMEAKGGHGGPAITPSADLWRLLMSTDCTSPDRGPTWSLAGLRESSAKVLRKAELMSQCPAVSHGKSISSDAHPGEFKPAHGESTRAARGAPARAARQPRALSASAFTRASCGARRGDAGGSLGSPRPIGLLSLGATWYIPLLTTC